MVFITIVFGILIAMNRFVRIAGVSLVSVLIVAGTVWAESGGFRGPDPVTEVFPNQKIEVPINTGSARQTRKGAIDFSSSTDAYPLVFSTNQGIDVGGGQFVMNGDLQFTTTVTTDPVTKAVTSKPNGVLFSDGTNQITAAYGRYKYGKFCSVVGPGWRDSFVAPDDFTIAACQKYAADTSATNGWSLGCMTANGVVLGAGGSAVPVPNCGWPVPPVRPPPSDKPCPTYNWHTNVWMQCP